MHAAVGDDVERVFVTGMQGEAVTAARATLRAAGVPVVDDPAGAGVPEFLLSLGEMGALIAARDWSQTPLGPPSGWPAELWAAIETCLPSRIPMLVWWGPELVQVYNDAYVTFLGAKQPRGLGQPGAECWADVWDEVGPLAEGVLAGRGAVYGEELPLLMERHGYPEETYWTFSYSPIHDHSGAVRGVFVATSDVTARVLTDRRMRILRDLGQVSALDAGSVEAVLATTLEVLAGCRADLPFVAAYWLDGREPVARCGDVDDAPALADAATQVLREGRTLLVDSRATGRAAAHPHTAVVLPIVADGRRGALALGVSPLRVLDDDYRAFLDLVAARTSTMCTEVVTHLAERARAEREAVVARFTARLLATDDAASMLEVGLDELRVAVGAPGAVGLVTAVEERVLARGVLPVDVPTDASGLRRLVARVIGRDTHDPVTGGLVLAPASGPGPLPLIAWVGPLPGPPAGNDRALVVLLAERLAEGLRRARAQERVTALASVAVAVSAAETAEQVTDLILEQGLAALGADGGAVAVLGDGGVLHATITESLGAQAVATYGRFHLDGRLPAAVAAATGERVLLSDRTAALAFAPEMADVLTHTGCQAWASLPLRGGDKGVLGSLSVGWVRPRDFPPRQVELLDAFAAHCAQGLERIATREAERAVATATRRLAETLQRSLLTEPVQPDHLQVAARYRAAARDAKVGGDWYDAFLNPAEELTLVIGDIAGHDRRAAAAMGQARNLLRGLTFAVGEPPGEVLTKLDRAMAHFAVGTPATAIVAQIEQTAAEADRGVRRVRWSNAGHPPPLLLYPDGTATLLRTPPVVLLGALPDAARTDHQAVLPIGSTLLLYTDGLFERRGEDVDEGLARLVAIAEELAGLDLETLCDELLEAMADDEYDDVALLGVRAFDAARPRPPEAGPERLH